MPRLWLLATRNWSASPGRTIASLLSIALGVGTVVILGNFYETARLGIEHEVAVHWLGASHITVHPLGAHWGGLPEDLAHEIQQLGNVKTASARLKRKLRCYHEQGTAPGTTNAGVRVDVIGIDPATADALVGFPKLVGQRLATGQPGHAVIERLLAGELNAAIGDTVCLTGPSGTGTVPLKVIGLFNSSRIGEFQSPYVYVNIRDLQAIVSEPGVASAIDIILHRADTDAMAATKALIEDLLAARSLGPTTSVETAEFRETLLQEARRITKLSMTLAAFIAMLSAFFIILTTMSMSLFERTGNLGIMRCIGMTRRQLAGLLLVELVPLGIAGIALGIAGGIGVTGLTANLLRHSGIIMHVNLWGIALAVASGVFTTLVTILFLVAHIVRITPLAALRSQAKPPRSRYLVLSGVLGLVLITVHETLMAQEDQTRWLTFAHAALGTASIYLGYVLLTPWLVLLLGPPIARLIGPLLGLRGKLAEDQFGRAPWRSTGVCWMLVVGLSLIVYIAVSGASMLKIWNFSGRLPEGFVWAERYVSRDVVSRAVRADGVKNVDTLVDIDCKIEPVDREQPVKDGLFYSFLNKLTRPVFVGCEPRRLMSMVKISFKEGNLEDALAKLDSGGHVLIPSQTASNHDLHLGDKVNISLKDRSETFTVAAVVESPVLDLTVSTFQASSYMQFAAANVVIGTNADLLERFDLAVASLVIFDISFPESQPPAQFLSPSRPQGSDIWAVVYDQWLPRLPYNLPELDAVRTELANWREAGYAQPPPVALQPVAARVKKAFNRAMWNWKETDPRERWLIFCERLLLRTIADRMERPEARTGSLRRLKEAVDKAIGEAMTAMTWLPAIVLVVAAVGIGNLMMVSVQIRARQIAVLRAVGAVKSQIVRLVLAEAISLGLVGSVCGIALGAHLAFTDNRVTGALLGFEAKTIIPWGHLGLGVVLTLGVCLTAGLIPARRAARNDIVTAMQAF